ncbi:rhodanese-like domain-containing protein [Micromonospora sp. LOL_023]|uniref:rhodanese-like domain-containing protein n=1 Tax=Micromonospora sp. LOL_023 TaxID=3345418 RepID=UPI003A89FC0C
MIDRLTPASRVTVARLVAALDSERPPVVLDVRNAGERDAGAIDGALHIPLAELPRRIAEVPTDRPVVVHCAGGYRSSVAASLLRVDGHPDGSDLLGGYQAWRAAHLPTAVG